MAQIEFVDYLRDQVFAQTCIVLIVFVALTILSLLLLGMDKGGDPETSKLFKMMCIQASCCTASLFFAMLLSLKFSRLIDFFGLSV